jgi:predicted HAD superfamily phosphohydrolase
MTGMDWDLQKLNEERIKWLQQFDDMKFHERSIITLDDVFRESVSTMIGRVIDELDAMKTTGRNAAKKLLVILRRIGLAPVQ